MPRFVELWIYLSATPLFGLTATLVTYLLASAAYARLGSAPWANPVLWSVIVLAGGLLATGVDYPSYFAGAQFIHDQQDSLALVASQDGRFTVFAYSPCEGMVHAHRIETLLL